MNKNCRTLEQHVQALTETLAQTRIELSQEAESRKGVEAKADELAALRRALETELAQRVEVEAQWRQELGTRLEPARLLAQPELAAWERLRLEPG